MKDVANTGPGQEAEDGFAAGRAGESLTLRRKMAGNIQKTLNRWHATYTTRNWILMATRHLDEVWEVKSGRGDYNTRRVRSAFGISIGTYNTWKAPNMRLDIKSTCSDFVEARS